MFVKHLGCVKNRRQTYFCLLFFLALILLLGAVFQFWGTKVIPTCESTHFYGFWPVTHLNKNLCRESDSSLGKKAFQNNKFMLRLHHQLSADSAGLNNWCHLAKVAGDFCCRGRGISSLSWDLRLRLYSRDLQSTRLPLKKQAMLRCSLQMNPLPSHWELKIQCPFLNSWDVLAGVTGTIYFLNKMACNVLGLHVSYCSVCKGCFVCLHSLYCQSLAYCCSQCCGVLWGRTASVKPNSGLKKCVSLSEVFLVPAFVIEPYKTLYNFFFFFLPNLFSSLLIPCPCCKPFLPQTQQCFMRTYNSCDPKMQFAFQASGTI